MKICIWVTKIFDLGGTKRVVTLLANELVKEHDVTIMCYQDRNKEDRTMFHMSEDIKVDFIDNNEFVSRRWTPAFGFRCLIKKLNGKGYFNEKRWNDLLADAIFPRKTQERWVEYLNAQNYDIIITTASLSLRLGMLADRLNAKTIGWQHNCYDGYINVPNVVFWKQESLLQEYLPKLDRYIVLSEYDKRDYMEKLGIDSEVKINPRSFVSEKKCDPHAKRFLMATRFVYAKGLDLMMKSFEEFCKEDDEWELDILGSGELFKKIVADAQKRGLTDRVHFVGYTNEPEKYYLNSSVFLLPSRWEGWPMVIMEAFEFGLPVIAFHTGAMDLIIDDGKTGYLPEAFDTHEFTQAMLRLAHDEDLRLAMHRNAIEKSGDFAIENAVKAWDGLFLRLQPNTTGEDYAELYEQACDECSANPNEELRAKYAEYLNRLPLKEHTVLYESYGGRGMTCSPYAIFCYLLEKPEYAGFEHVWAIDDMEDNRWQMDRYANQKNVRFVQYQSLEYREYLASAKYLINNVGFPGYFTKRDGQIYVNTWHGIPLKTIGFDIPAGNLSSGNSARNFLAADYLISPNSFMTEIYRSAFKLDGLYEGTILEAGQPRNDRYFQTERRTILEKLEEAGVSADPEKKIILYAPTWKGEKYSTPDTSLHAYEELIRQIEARVDRTKYQVLVKPHQIVYYNIKKKLGDAGHYIPATVDTNELLAVTDVLISDYSSIYFDFLVSGKPILFFIPDLEEYRGSRGLYFGVDKLPGPIAGSYEELARMAADPEKACAPYREKYAREAAWACPHDDGEVCARLAGTVFGVKTSSKTPSANAVHCPDSGKKRLLFYPGSFEASGRIFSFLELVGHLDYEKYDVTVLAQLTDDEDEKQRICSLPKPVRVLYRRQLANRTRWEKTLKRIDELGGEPFDEENLKNCDLREFCRLFGGSHYDCAVDFSGGSGMLSEFLQKLPGCRTVSFDGRFLDTGRMEAAASKSGRIPFSGEELLLQEVQGEGGVLQLKLLKQPDGGRMNFVTMGRLEEEKGFDTLLGNFAEYHGRNPESHLYILGNGSEKPALKQLAETLQLEDAVTFAGFISSPFALMKACQAYVKAPGQREDSLSVLEAASLGLPVYDPDFSGKVHVQKPQEYADAVEQEFWKRVREVLA